MFELYPSLAQEIVSRSMAILPYNLNVMDSQGLIIGSGETERINTRHEGAQLVIANGRTVELDASSAQALRNVQPGVNVPLKLDGKLVGVLGITGDPVTVRTYASLVRMTAEMLLAQRLAESQRHWRQQRSEELQYLLLGDEEPSQRATEEASQLGLRPNLARVPYGLDLSAESSVSEMIQWLSNRYTDSWSARLGEQALLWCPPRSVNIHSITLVKRAAQQGFEILRVAEGAECDQLRTLRSEAQQVADLLHYGREVLPDTKYLQLNSYRLQTRLWRLKDDPAITKWLAPILVLQDTDRGGVLLETLHAWFAHNGQKQACADFLGVHRNSLRYRMERIHQITGLSLEQTSDLVSLYLGSCLIQQGKPALL
ncbi:CdaR family transcriptional regulator [Pseudomonas monteilii]|uniref:CdaR family transcriptional regulator n=1 Tax=Pseudomonas monteilii TaxID=76759 RepID=UPI003D00C133